MSNNIDETIAYHEHRARQERHRAVHAVTRQARRVHAMLSKLHQMMRYDLQP